MSAAFSLYAAAPVDIPAPAPAARSPATARRTRRKEARPGELLAAALALFVEKGFAATRVEEVAARAGVSKGTLFVYFPSKEDLFKAVVHENAGRQLAAALAEVAAYAGSSAELVREFLGRWWTQYGGTPAAGLTKLMVGEAANFPELARYYQQEVVQPSHALVREIVQRGIRRGEFRAVDLALVPHLVLAPLVHWTTWRFSLACCLPESARPDMTQLLALHAEMILRALAPAADCR